LSLSTLLDIYSTHTSYTSSLLEAGLVVSTSPAEILKLSPHSANEPLVRALIASALYPNIARIVLPATKYEKISTGSLALDPEARAIKFYTSDLAGERSDRVFVHPSSTLFSATSFIDNSSFAAYFTRVQTSKAFLRDITPVNSFAILLLCGNKIEIDQMGRGVCVGPLRLKAWARIGTLLAVLRRLLDVRLNWKIQNPELSILEDEVIGCLRTLMEK